MHFNGVLKPRSGTVLYDSKEISYSSKPLATLRSEIAVVMQNPDDQIFSTTVEEDVAFGPMNLRLPMEEVDRRVEEALFLVGMTEFRQRPSQQLSFGQRKRVALAGALAMKPKVLVMDEPTAGLDPQMVHELLELTDELAFKGMTVIMSTHDVEMAYSWADELHVMQGGRLIYSGIPENFFSEPGRVHRAGLVVPFLFEINKQLQCRRGIDCRPFPKTFSQLVGKTIPVQCKMGTLFLIPVDGNINQRMMYDITHNSNAPVRIGVYGTAARRIASKDSIAVDFFFNAVESSVMEVCQGRNAIVYHDRALAPLISSRLDSLKDHFGTEIPRLTM